MPQKTPAAEPQAPVKGRISARVRQALHIRVTKALPWDECAREAGLSPAGLYKARLKPHVEAEHERLKTQYTQQLESMKGQHRARAFQVGRELMDTAKSEAVRARMVEFFAGEAKAGPSVQVNVQNNMGHWEGYEYAPPGSQVVEIRAAGDDQSPATDEDDQGNTEA